MKQNVWRKMNLSLNMLRILWTMQEDGFNSAFMGMSMNACIGFPNITEHLFGYVWWGGSDTEERINCSSC